MGEGITRVVLPDGTPVWARIANFEELAGPPTAPPSGYADTTHTRSSYSDTAYSDSAHPDSAHPDSTYPDNAHPGAGSHYSNYSDTGLRDRATARMDSLRELITGVAGSLAEGLRDARPDEVSVSFGIELAGSAGKVVGLLADGSVKGSITVTLTWQGGPPDDVGSDG